MASYESLYPGALYSTPNPSYYTPPSSYQTSAGNLGMALDARTANQLGDLNIKLNPGEKFVEIQGISGATMESIPNQHLDEMRRLSELTGVQMSLHGPLLNASGIEGQGGYTEENRLGAENQIKSAVLRAHQLDPKGNINVTFHSSANLPSFTPHIVKHDKEGKSIREDQGFYIINERSGQINIIRPPERYFDEDKKEFTGKPVEFDVKNELERINKETWLSQLTDITRTAEFGEDSIERAKRNIILSAPRELRENEQEITKLADNIVNNVAKGIKGDYLEEAKKLGPEYKEIIKDVERGVVNSQTYLRQSYRGFKDLFDNAWDTAVKSGNKKDQELLKSFANNIKPEIYKDFDRDPENIGKLSNVIEDGIKVLDKVSSTPQTYIKLNEFAVKKSAETFANAAEEAYKKFGKTAPVISIENPPGGEALSTGEELRNLIKESRNKLSENLKNQGFSNKEAEKIASQMIGATWDVGHINMMRKKGYSEKDVIEETKKIAPFVKHVHLSDNFGLDHTELPMGMGNVPLKPMLDEIKKQGFKGKEIIEAGNWWQFFSTQGGGNPFITSLEGMNSPIYAMTESPGWSTGGVYGGYFSGHGPINPPLHHQIYQAGFQNMPVELGGEIPSDRGRFAGTPNQ